MPLALLGPLLQAAIQALTELLKYLQTPEGQAWAAELRRDGSEMRKALGDARGWLAKLFAGQIFRFDGTNFRLGDQVKESLAVRESSRKTRS